jgi:hypothetical protein
MEHDGYRLQLRRVADSVRLFTRRGYDWRRPPPFDSPHGDFAASQVVHARRRGRGVRSYGVAIFDALPRPGTVSDAMLYAFDLLELDGEDPREMPLVDRKKRIARLPAQAAGRHRSQRPHRRGRHHALPAGLQLGLDPGKRDELDLDEPVGPNFPLRYKPTPPARPLRVNSASR